METKTILLSESENLSGWGGLVLLTPLLILLGIAIFSAVKKEEGSGMAITMMLGMCLMFYALFNFNTEGLKAIKGICLITGIASLMWIVMAIGLHFKWPGFVTSVPNSAKAMRNFLLMTTIPGSLAPTIMGVVYLLKHSVF